MLGVKTPNGVAPKGLAIGKGTLTRQTTPVAGCQRKAEGTRMWMTMMGWEVSRRVIYGSWTICWCPKFGLRGVSNDMPLHACIHYGLHENKCTKAAFFSL